MVRDYSRRQFIAGCGCAGAGALAAGGATAASGERRRVTQDDVRWNRTYESDGNAEANAVVPAVDDDGLVVAGATEASDEHDRVAWLYKIDRAGNVVWERTYSRQSVTVARDLVTTDDGYLLAGITRGGPDDGQDGFAIRVDTEGSVQWEKTFWNRNDTDDSVNGVVRRSDGGFVCAGETSRFGKAWLIKLSADGEAGLSESIGGGDEARFNDVARHPNGGYLVVGSGDDNTDDVQGWVTRVNESFEQVWVASKFFRKGSDSSTNPYNDFNSFYSVTGGNQGFTLVGASAFDPDTADRSGWILKINIDGDEQWDKLLDEDRHTELKDILWDKDDLQYFAVGRTATNADGVDGRGYVANVGLAGGVQSTATYSATDAESSRFASLYRTDANGLVCVGSASPTVASDPNGWGVKLGGEQVATATPSPTPSPTPTPTATPSPTATQASGQTETSSPAPTTGATTTPTATATPAGGGGTDPPATTTVTEAESGLPLTTLGVGVAIVALATGGFLYNRFSGGDDGDEQVAGPGAGTGGAATLTDTDAASESDSEAGGSGPKPASEVEGGEEVQSAETVVDKPDTETGGSAESESDGDDADASDGGTADSDATDPGDSDAGDAGGEGDELSESGDDERH